MHTAGLSPASRGSDTCWSSSKFNHRSCLDLPSAGIKIILLGFLFSDALLKVFTFFKKSNQWLNWNLHLYMPFCVRVSITSRHQARETRWGYSCAKELMLEKVRHLTSPQQQQSYLMFIECLLGAQHWVSASMLFEFPGCQNKVPQTGWLHTKLLSPSSGG